MRKKELRRGGWVFKGDGLSIFFASHLSCVDTIRLLSLGVVVGYEMASLINCNKLMI